MLYTYTIIRQCHHLFSLAASAESPEVSHQQSVLLFFFSSQVHARMVVLAYYSLYRIQELLLMSLQLVHSLSIIISS